MVFDGVVSASWQHLGHLRPLVAVGSVGQEQNPLFMRHPIHLKDTWVEVVVPPLPALLAQPSLHELGNEGPPLRSVLLHQSSHQVVLGLGPWLLPQKPIPPVLPTLPARVIIILLSQHLLFKWLLPHPI